jgi:hypothetical protein
MSTKRGGKVNVKEQPTIESDVRKIFNPYSDDLSESNAEPKPEVFEVDVNKLSDETQEVHYGFIGEPVVNETIDDDMKEGMMTEGAKTVAEFVDNKILEDLKKIATEPPVTEKPKRRIEDLGQSELRLYQRTGIIPQ